MPPFDVSILPSRNFRPRVYGVGAWTDHIFFACDLMALERPARLVELGTDRGESYFAFCQAAAENRVNTRCFAVDTWKGDAQTGSYDDVTFQNVQEHNRAHYQKFSTLLRRTFDEAAAEFTDIDLLHLDGFHSEEAVRHDLDNWLPKISPGGILLLHDVNVRQPGFGVWRVWEELKSRGRSFTFAEGPGLGVWEKPPARDSLLRNLLFGPDHESATALARYYRERVQELREQIDREWRTGAVRQGPLAGETVIQVFFSSDGTHCEADAVLARVGHEAWKDVSIPLPANAGAAPLRIDFLSALHVIEIARIRVASSGRTYFEAATPAEFDQVLIRGDAERLPDPASLRLKITGIDPQLYLPRLDLGAEAQRLVVEMRLKVCPPAPGQI